MTERWLVTGGAGFIGSQLVDLLLRRGDQVVVVDDFSAGSVDNLPSFGNGPRLSVRKADVTNAASLAAAMATVSGVFHCAATVRIQDCIDDWFGAHATNATATIRLFEIAQRKGNLPVVYASSAAVYGNRSGEICHEDLPVGPVSPYGADKLACENHARAFWQVHRLPTAGLRLFNVYGPRQTVASSYSGVLAQFGRNWQTGRPHVVFGDGLQSRDFVYVSDVVAGMAAAMDRLHQTPQCLVSNICTGRSVSILDLLAIFERVAGRPLPGPIEFRPARAGEIRNSQGGTTRMAELLGLRRTVKLEDGLRTYLASLKHSALDVMPLVQVAE
ncbi:MAG: NAD-dependent epimerase/dehydratase family protein [Pseudomonadota bacterium]